MLVKPSTRANAKRPERRPASLPSVHAALLEWYARHGRDLPWRRTRDPYAILVSEVMLQQTQVERVIPTWHAWLERFPSFEALASSSRADAIRAWQGLGYNLRAVRLHAIARQVVADFGGQLPHSIDELMRLKGVGRYTAGAVACFAFEQPVAMVDTNVRRVLSRVFGVSAEHVAKVADEIVPAEAAYAWNQALMDLGATLCRNDKPLCLVCPLLAACRGPSSLHTVGVASSKSEEPFAGSRRYFRGRVLDELRSSDQLCVNDLLARVGSGIADVLAQLAADGLVEIDSDNRVQLAH